ncbi:hypothetical protein TARUN_10200 [Trichoderma arundinaceum]|uniref:Secreted protein n=1 Tax=Trichoderma arundinaceum TaxID=490622 RepID=A0A395N866_TRIAR|nr:hypothetical protein TARUN_10200 [Trichoderma arundinaceum]
MNSPLIFFTSLALIAKGFALCRGLAGAASTDSEGLSRVIFTSNAKYWVPRASGVMMRYVPSMMMLKPSTRWLLLPNCKRIEDEAIIAGKGRSKLTQVYFNPATTSRTASVFFR